MVLNLCRRVLRHEQDAEDAFQATFLILSRKARSIGKRRACASWLYKVAYRVALAARTALATRAERERPCPEEWPAAAAPDDLVATTSEAAVALAAGKAVAAVASARAAALTEGVIRTMFLTKLKLALGAVLALTVAGFGAALVGERLSAAPPPAAQEKARQQ